MLESLYRLNSAFSGIKWGYKNLPAVETADPAEGTAETAKLTPIGRVTQTPQNGNKRP